MIFDFNYKKHTCFFCKKKVRKKEKFILEYKTLDGINKVDICPTCATELNDMKEIFEDEE